MDTARYRVLVVDPHRPGAPHQADRAQLLQQTREGDYIIIATGTYANMKGIAGVMNHVPA
ncbi:MAG TPA: hypothetical protein VN039_00125 [Nitrospira sp.]|nr:hypothetical protein [Nitrospira sp.]